MLFTKKKINYFIKTLIKRGLLFFFFYFKESLFFDFIRKTDTSIRVEKTNQNTENASKYSKIDGLLYVASFTSVISKTIDLTKKYIGHNLFTEYQFIDLGCGKGKSIIFFLEKFNKIKKFPPIGIEYDKNLYVVAKNNIFNICKYKKNDALIFLDSATNLKNYISSKNLIVYLYNSFQGKTLDKVLNILGNYNHILIYVDPAQEKKIKDSNYTIIKRRKGKYNADTWIIAIKNLNE